MSIRTLTVLAIALCAAACEDTGDDDNTTDTNDDDGTTTTTVSYAADIDPIFAATCLSAGCHSAADSAGSLDLETDGFAAVVDVASTQATSLDLVTGGSTTDSYLWHKLNGTQAAAGGSGANMPIAGSLTDDELDLIEDWITGGAAE